MSDDYTIPEALQDVFGAPNLPPNDAAANVVDALFAIARALDDVAGSIHRLGSGDALTSMGAIEGHSVIMRDGLAGIASSLEAIAIKIPD